jgi:phage FluMu gp28-like protein
MLIPELIPRSREDIEEKALFTLLPYQMKYILDESPILGIEKGRQLGLTWASGYKIPRRIFNARRVENHYWISRDEFTAKLFLQDVLYWINQMNRFRNHKKEFKQDIIDLKGVQAMRITFDCGSCIHVMSSSVDAIAGKRGHVYIDEASLHKDFRQLFDIAKPATRWGYTLTFFSTHRSKQNYFFKLIEKIKKGEVPSAKVMSITLVNALNEGYLHRINDKSRMLGGRVYASNTEFFEEEKAQASSEEMFLQENMCIPADADATQAVKEDDLARVMFPQQELFGRPQSGKRYFAGIDIGRNRDLTVLWICEDISTGSQPMLVARHMEIMSKVDFSTQEKNLAKLLQEWKPRHCMIDGTNVGAMIAENLEKRFSFCEAVKITAVTRPRFISDLVAFIRREPVSLKIPNSNEVWADFLSVERFINKFGKEDFFIPAHRGTDSHGDRFMAMTLCLQSFLSKRSLARYTLSNEGKERTKPVKKLDKKVSVRQKFRF